MGVGIPLILYIAMIRNIIAAAFAFYLPFAAFGQQKARKAVFIIVDGISSNTVEQITTPNLDEIARTGGYAQAYVGGEKGTYSQTPTISAVGYNSLLTGTWVNKHNVWDNRILEPNYNYWTIFRFFESQYPQKHTAVFSTWLDNRTKLVGENLPQTGHLRLDYSFDGFELDTLRFRHDGESEYIRGIDELVSGEAGAYLKEKGPDLSWVYLQYTDDMGHKYGDSEQFHNAVRLMDTQVGRIWEAVQYRRRELGEDWQVYITTDHGRDAKSGQNHGGQSDRERGTWIVTNAGDLNAEFRETKPGVVDIMPSIARHLGISFPKDQAFEIDGTPLTGPLSFIDYKISYDDKKIRLTWKALQKGEKVKIWLATTNHFEKGGTDHYLLAGEAPVEDGKAEIDVSQLPAGFFKVALEGKYNTANKWLVGK